LDLIQLSESPSHWFGFEVELSAIWYFYKAERLEKDAKTIMMNDGRNWNTSRILFRRISGGKAAFYSLFRERLVSWFMSMMHLTTSPYV